MGKLDGSLIDPTPDRREPGPSGALRLRDEAPIRSMGLRMVATAGRKMVFGRRFRPLRAIGNHA
jgi:hypothetical protein